MRTAAEYRIDRITTAPTTTMTFNTPTESRTSGINLRENAARAVRKLRAAEAEATRPLNQFFGAEDRKQRG